MKHQIHLFYLRNRPMIHTSLLSIVLITILVLEVVSVCNTLASLRSTDTSLRGISCILTLDEDDRTKDNVSECIDINARSPEPFEFKTIDTPHIERLPDLTLPSIKSETQKRSEYARIDQNSEDAAPYVPTRVEILFKGKKLHKYEGDTLLQEDR